MNNNTRESRKPAKTGLLMQMIEKSDTPCVSVIVPAYNNARHIADAVESVLEQNFQDHEIIIVDDGSTDNTREALAPYSGLLNYYRQENQGEPAARNAGIRRARGEFLAFLDADDFWHPEYLRRQVEEMRRRPGVALSFAAAVETDTAGRPTRHEYRELPPVEERLLVVKSILRSNPTRPSGCLFRRDLLGRHFFDPTLDWGNDWDLVLQTAILHPIYYLREPLYYYRRHRGAMYPIELKRGQELYRLRILQKAFDRLGDLLSEQAKNRERAIACIHSACLRSASGDGQKVREWMEKAFQLDPGFFVPPAREFVPILGQFLEDLYEFGTPRRKAREVVERICRAMPADPGEIRSLQSRVLGHFLGVHAFGSYERGRPREALASGLQAVRRSPGWLRNRGFVSVVLRGALGQSRVLE